MPYRFALQQCQHLAVTCVLLWTPRILPVCLFACEHNRYVILIRISVHTVTVCANKSRHTCSLKGPEQLFELFFHTSFGSHLRDCPIHGTISFLLIGYPPRHSPLLLIGYP